MTEETKTPGLEEFIRYMSGASEISELSKTAEQDSRSANKDTARTAITQRGYELASSRGDVDLESFDPSNPGHYDLAKNYVIGEQRELIENASNLLDSNLEGIVGEIDDKKLEGLARSKEIAEASGEDYSEWRNHYMQYQATLEIRDRIKAGDRDENVERMAKGAAIKKASENARKDAKEKGYSMDIQDTRAELAAQALRIGYKKVNYEEAAEELVRQTEEELRKYESESGKNARGYVTEGLKNLAGSGTDGFNVARSLVYTAASSKD